MARHLPSRPSMRPTMTGPSPASWPALSIALACAALPVGSSAAAAPPNATAQLRQSNERLDRLLKRNGKAEDEAARKEMRAIVNGLLDYDELSRRSLAAHWEGLTPQQRTEFVSTLRELIERNYLKQLRTNLDYEVRYRDEGAGGAGAEGEALVSTVVKVRTKGKSTDMAIDYKMRRTAGQGGDRWMVFDIITDDVSMVRNYRQQFNRIITSEGFPALLAKMRKKINEVDADEPGTKEATATPAPVRPAGPTGVREAGGRRARKK